MKDETGTRFQDWIDHIAVPWEAGLEARLRESGFTKKPQKHAPDLYECDLGIFPGVILARESTGFTKDTHIVAIKAESVIDFLAAHNLPHFESVNDGLPDKGTGSRLRMALGHRATSGGKTYELWAMERHGFAEYDYDSSTSEQRIKAQQHAEIFRTRRRFHENDAQAFVHMNQLVDAAIKDIGRDWTCDLFFEAERRYWQKRNRAAQVQYARQSKLGLGWANHDHHTYRCSRESFPRLIALWEKLGFHCREAFYAGAEAGWGAQVCEQPVTKITTFNDVDMSPEELFQDFSHKGFTEHRSNLGTVGLWVGLHGEAVLQAGMHHLECQFDWHALVAQLEKEGGVKHMAPFTTFPYLRQAFTEGERWKIDPARVDVLLRQGFITNEQAAIFNRDGAIGSHMENLERNDGFKGFNQQGVSDIIARTDPRRLAELVGA